MKKWFAGLVLVLCVFCFGSAAQASLIPYDDLWMADTSQLGATFELMEENAWFAKCNSFGLYQDLGGDHPLTMEIFKGSDGPGAVETLTWDTLTGSGFSLNREFGFYLDSSKLWFLGGGLFLSETDAGHSNHGRDFLQTTFDGESYLLNWEDNQLWLNKGPKCVKPDYNDMIVKVSGMSPTPIPGALLLLLGGLPVALIRKFR
ncbi:hypothetical protein [Desulfoplanes formicivorans]|uniref:PEP-CTERM protein-sorting domain-containing protein n=1 Tax=Desulfoplanes formicivorans TaxID=1592317 RepID=A0A194AFE4_9BACT|nr:hypothetical protein [Desulfoplanes formicivorans]GAU07811.1 hypothetical protein DPF_0510 [Desulfoplanes formicivorans]